MCALGVSFGPIGFRVVESSCVSVCVCVEMSVVDDDYESLREAEQAPTTVTRRMTPTGAR